MSEKSLFERQAEVLAAREKVLAELGLEQLHREYEKISDDAKAARKRGMEVKKDKSLAVATRTSLR
jgi:hypothetical protein